MQARLLGIIGVDFYITGKLLIVYSAFIKHLRQMGIQWGSASAVIDVEKACNSVRREVVYNLTEFGIFMMLVQSIQMCLGEICSMV